MHARLRASTFLIPAVIYLSMSSLADRGSRQGFYRDRVEGLIRFVLLLWCRITFRCCCR